MKFLKKLFYGIMFSLMAVFAMILLCALNPNLTQSLATLLYGEGNTPGIVKNETVTVGNNITGTGEGTYSGSSAGNTSEDTGRNPSDIISGLLPSVILPEEESQTQTTPAQPARYEVTVQPVTEIPSSVNNLSGYLPIEEVKEEIGDSVAKALKESLGTGPDGSEYAFDTLFYPYYAMLSPSEQKVYAQLYANAMEATAAFAPVEKINTSDFATVFEAVVGDHPELFFMETGYSVKYTKSGQVVEVDLAYYTLTNDVDKSTEKLEAAAEPILKGASALGDDYSKARYVHNALISLVEYDAKASMNQSAYSAQVNGRSVCAGYARAYQYILQKLDIPCYYCTGSSGEEHAWNIVKLPDGYYNVDVTWDDTDPSTYDYFMRTDSDFAGTHVRKSLSVNLPACQATGYRGLETTRPDGSATEGNNGTVLADTFNSPMDNVQQEPMQYDRETATAADVETSPTESEQQAEILKKLGLTKEGVDFSETEYYADCLSKMVAAGSGSKQFVCVVSKSVYDRLETIYGGGGYEKGYVQTALEKLGMNHFAIQIQAQNLGDGYYKLYHNISTWYE